MDVLPEKTGVYRITHYRNLPFILKNGIHSPDSSKDDPEFVPIGFPTLVAHRNLREVKIAPYGTLAD